MKRKLASITKSLFAASLLFAFFQGNAQDYFLQEVNLVNYLGNLQNIHPKVLYFDNGWNGYKFWMAYTPYPFGTAAYENPCLAASNDGINWELPNGCPSPLASKPDYGFNSDTHLVYREDTGRLECWWRGYADPLTMDNMLMISSADGTSWTDPVVVAPWDGIFKLSPAIHCSDGRYIMYYVNGLEIYITRSGRNFDYTTWSTPFKINLGDPSAKVWHVDVVPSDDKVHEILFQDCGINGDSNQVSSLCYFKYNENNNTSSEIVRILDPDGSENSALGKGIYRSSFVNAGNEQFIYVSSISFDHQRHMSVAHGTNLIERMVENAKTPVFEIEKERSDIYLEGNTLYSSGNQCLTVYDASGRKVGAGYSVELPLKGLYIVTSNGVTKKIIY